MRKTKKAASLILALILVLSLIPLGSLGVSAIEINADDPEGTVYVINSVDDWKAVSKASEDGLTFAGRTVKLGKDLLGTKESPLVIDTLFPKSFQGTFDGDGKTVSYVNISTTKSQDALISGVAKNAVIKNVILDNITMRSGYNQNGIVVGFVNAGSIEIESVTIQNSTVNNTSNSPIGAVIGYADIASESRIDKVVLSNVTVSTEKGQASGIIGHVRDCKGDLNISNIVLNKLSLSNVNPTTSGRDAYSSGAIIGQFVGRNSSNVSCNISGVTTTVSDQEYSVEINTKHNKGGAGGLVGRFAPTAGAIDLEIENVNLKLNIVEDNYYTDEQVGVGGLVGEYVAYTDSDLTVNNVQIKGILTARKFEDTNGRMGVGGFIGRVSEYSVDTNPRVVGNEDNYAGTISITNSEMGLNVSNDTTTDNMPTGGMIGWYGPRGTGASSTDNGYPDTSTEAAALIINNCVVSGAVSGETNAVGGIVGWGAFSGAAWNINNILFTGTITTTDADNVGGLIVGRSIRTKYSMTLKNISKTGTGAFAMSNSLSGGDTINGVTYEDGDEGYTRFTAQNDTVLVVTAEKAAKMVKRNDAGYITSVEGHLYGGYEQHTSTYEDKDGNEVYDVRFIALSNVDNAKAYNITVKAIMASGNIIFDNLAVSPYEELIGYNGIETIKYKATELGGKVFLAVLITDVPTGEAIDFEVTASYTTESGVVISDATRTASFDADGICNSVPVEPQA